MVDIWGGTDPLAARAQELGLIRGQLTWLILLRQHTALGPGNQAEYERLTRHEEELLGHGRRRRRPGAAGEERDPGSTPDGPVDLRSPPARHTIAASGRSSNLALHGAIRDASSRTRATDGELTRG